MKALVCPRKTRKARKCLNRYPAIMQVVELCRRDHYRKSEWTCKYNFSFPRAAWECSQGALRREYDQRLAYTGRGAWERGK